MSSEQEEGADHLDEPNANSSASAGDQPFDTKTTEVSDHAKPRRRRRGKKRKHKKESAAAVCEVENRVECESELQPESEHETQAECESPVWDSDENLSCDIGDSYGDVIIRPFNVPKAPENSTQFIMDDHNDCRFYRSFETPNPYWTDPPQLDGEDSEIIEPILEDAAFIDIDYEYESPQDFDNSAYYDKDFENSYKSNRFDELMRLSRTDLISAIHTLEARLQELSGDLVKENPSPILEKLQAELLELQERHKYLKECNAKLSDLVHHDTENKMSPVEVTTEDVFTCEENNRSLVESEKNSKDVLTECKQSLSVKESDIVVQTSDINSKEFDCGLDLKSDQSINLTVSNNLSSVSENHEMRTDFSNSHTRHQPNNSIKDDLRTVSISSDLFCLATQSKCSSGVVIEGGMSPSETSVN